MKSSGSYAPHPPAAHYEQGHIVLALPTPELVSVGRTLPGIRRHKNGFKLPATAHVAARVLELYGPHGLEGTQKFGEYLLSCAEGFQKAHEALVADKLPDLPVTVEQPEGVWYHQRRAFWFAYHLEAAMLAVTMGGGKTKIAIDLMQNWNARDVLIISPLAACTDAWIRQLEGYVVPDRDYEIALSYEGTQQRRVEAAEHVLAGSTDFRIVLINHESFWREPMRSFLSSREWDLIIADEIHREKSAGSKQSKFLFELSTHARRRLGLTGTPMSHSPLDVYGQFRFLDRGIYGTNVAAFQQEYAVFGGYQFKEVIGYRNLAKLEEKFKSIGIVVSDSEQGLPETVDITHSVKLEPATRRAYAEMEKYFITEVKEGAATAKNAGVKLLRLHQIASGILTTGEGKKTEPHRIGSEKIEAVCEVMEDLQKGEPVVIFTRFNPDTQDLTRKLGAYQLSGHKNELAEWKKKGGVLVAQIQAAKEGIDLTKAAVAIFYSTGISLGDYEQCRKRLHRPPQKRMVRFIHIVASGTRDVTTLRALRARQDVIAEVLRQIRSS